MTVRTVDDIFRDFVIPGVPASGPFNPHKPDIRDTLKALTEGSENFPDNRVIRLNNADAGTANNIVVTASVVIPAAAYQVLYILNVTQENTGPVTVSGVINRTIVTNTSRPIEPAYLQPGMALLCVDTGTELRLLSYGDADAILAAAEAAATRAEDAAAGLNLPSIGPDDVGKTLIVNSQGDGYELTLSHSSFYDSRYAFTAANVPDGVTFVIVAGYYTSGDGGLAPFRLIENEPSHPGKAHSADGKWWELCEVSPNVRQFGAKGDNVTDDTAAFSDALKYCESKALLYGGAASLRAPQGQYRTTGIEYNPDVYMPIKFYGDGPDVTMIRGMVGSTNPILRVNAAAPSFFHGHIEIADMTLDGDGHGASAGLEMNEVWYSVLRNVRAINCVRGYNLLTCIYVDIYIPDLHWNVVGMNIDKLVTSSFPDALPAVINVFGGLIRINSRIGIYADYMNSLTLYGTGIEYNGTLVGDAGHGGVIIGSNIDRSGKATGLSWYGGWIEGNKGDAGVQLYSGVNTIRDVRGWEPSGDTTYSIHIRGGQYTLDNLTTTGGSIKEEPGVSTGNRIACCYNFTKDIADNKTGVDEGASLKKAYITVGGPDMTAPSLVLQNGQVYFQFVLEGNKLKLKLGNTELESWG